MILNYNSTTIQVNDNCLIPQLVRDGLFGGADSGRISRADGVVRAALLVNTDTQETGPLPITFQNLAMPFLTPKS